MSDHEKQQHVLIGMLAMVLVGVVGYSLGAGIGHLANWIF